MEEKVQISMLCQLYGKLLTKKQYELRLVTVRNCRKQWDNKTSS